MYTEKELVGIAKRENNNLRKYLVLNRLQGKHIPVNPQDAFAMFDALAEEVRVHYVEQSLLLVGFAETATAIGARMAVVLDANYIQTTREQVDGADYLYFTESHSHATEQKLVRGGLECLLKQADRIIFIEDEVTTGNTIQKIIDIMRQRYGKNLKFSVASLLNGMNETALEKYQGQNIGIHYLVKTQHEGYTELAERYQGDGQLWKMENTAPAVSLREFVLHGYQNTRCGVQGQEYEKACQQLWKQLKDKLKLQQRRNQEPKKEQREILVLGTEEFMYPALFVAKCLKDEGFHAYSHSTTRSPILTSHEPEYPLQERYELVSFYEWERRTFIYNLRSYDTVIILTDAENMTEAGKHTLMQALERNQCKDIILVQWKEELTDANLV